MKFTVNASAARRHGIRFLQMAGQKGLGRGRKVCTGNNSGYAAVNLAYLLGAKSIVMLGFDMQMTGGRIHWHEDHKTNPTDNLFRNWIENFRQLRLELEKEGVELLNATRETALTVPRVELEACL